MNIFNFSLLTLCCLLLTACSRDFENSTDLQEVINFESFTVEVPDGWERIERQGIDSFVGEITNGEDTFTFDLGWYSYSFSNQTTETHHNQIRLLMV